MSQSPNDDTLDAFSDCGHIKVMWEGNSSVFVAIEDKVFLEYVKNVRQKVKENSDVDLIIKVSV